MRRRTSPSTPRVAPVELPDLVDADPADLDAGVLLDGVALRGLDLPPVNLAGAELVEVLVSRLTADDVDLTGARLREVAVEDARVNAWRMGRAHVQDAQFSGRFGVLDAQGGTWRSLILAGQEDGSVRAGEPAIVAATLAGAINWIPRWQRADGPAAPRQVAEMVVETLTRGVAA